MYVVVVVVCVAVVLVFVVRVAEVVVAVIEVAVAEVVVVVIEVAVALVIEVEVADVVVVVADVVVLVAVVAVVVVVTVVLVGVVVGVDVCEVLGHESHSTRHCFRSTLPADVKQSEGTNSVQSLSSALPRHVPSGRGSGVGAGTHSRQSTGHRLRSNAPAPPSAQSSKRKVLHAATSTWVVHPDRSMAAVVVAACAPPPLPSSSISSAEEMLPWTKVWGWAVVAAVDATNLSG